MGLKKGFYYSGSLKNKNLNKNLFLNNFLNNNNKDFNNKIFNLKTTKIFFNYYF